MKVAILPRCHFCILALSKFITQRQFSFCLLLYRLTWLVKENRKTVRIFLHPLKQKEGN